MVLGFFSSVFSGISSAIGSAISSAQRTFSSISSSISRSVSSFSSSVSSAVSSFSSSVSSAIGSLASGAYRTISSFATGAYRTVSEAVSQAGRTVATGVQAVQQRISEVVKAPVTAQVASAIQQVATATGKTAEQVATQIKSVLGTIPQNLTPQQIQELIKPITAKAIKPVELVGARISEAVSPAVQQIQQQISRISIPGPSSIAQALPKVELPKIELPKPSQILPVTTTAVLAPAVGIPKIEMPKIEMPKIEPPKLEIPQPISEIGAKINQGIADLIRARDIAYQSGDIAKIAPAVVADIILPLDLVKAIQTGGKSLEKPSDWFFVATDVIGLVPVLGWGVKAGLKGIAKALKIGAKVEEGITALAKGVKGLEFAKVTKTTEALEGAKVFKGAEALEGAKSTRLGRIATKLEGLSESIDIGKLSKISTKAFIPTFIGGAVTATLEAITEEPQPSPPSPQPNGQKEEGDKTLAIEGVMETYEYPVPVEVPYPVEVPTTTYYYYPAESTAPISYYHYQFVPPYPYRDQYPYYGYEEEKGAGEEGLAGEYGEYDESGSPSWFKRLLGWLDDVTSGKGWLVILALLMAGGYVGYRLRKKRRGG